MRSRGDYRSPRRYRANQLKTRSEWTEQYNLNWIASWVCISRLKHLPVALLTASNTILFNKGKNTAIRHWVLTSFGSESANRSRRLAFHCEMRFRRLLRSSSRLSNSGEAIAVAGRQPCSVRSLAGSTVFVITYFVVFFVIHKIGQCQQPYEVISSTE